MRVRLRSASALRGRDVVLACILREPESSFRILPGTTFPVTKTGAPMADKTTYLSLGAYYSADKRRDISREHDVGLWWLGDDWHAPRFRAAWVAETGELYVMQHEGTPGGGRVDVVASFATLDEVEERSEE